MIYNLNNFLYFLREKNHQNPSHRQNDDVRQPAVFTFPFANSEIKVSRSVTFCIVK